jgi:SPP1 Gp6-like portal protein
MAQALAEIGDPKEAGTPAWYLERLLKAMNARRRNLDLYGDYYSGKHRLLFATEKFRKAFGLLFSAFADNWCELVVDAVEERLNVEGFRIPTSNNAVEEITTGDSEAWDIWQANQLDADSQIAHTEALIYGKSYAIVGPGEDYPEITVESAHQVCVDDAPGYRRNRRAALKTWLDDEGFVDATLYLPDEIYKLRSVQKASPSSTLTRVAWERRIIEREEWPLRNPIGIVPVVPLVNRPRLLVDGVSEIALVIPKQDAVNKLIADMMVGSEFQAMRQRWATGLEIPLNPETGQPVDQYKSATDRLWTSASEITQFGEFAAADLQNFVRAVELLVQHIASQTRTPPHYFYLRGQFPSGESIKAAETGLVAKARRKMRHFGEGWEEVIRLAFLFLNEGDKAKAAKAAETIWGDPESRSESEHADALIKQQKLGVPEEILWERAGYSPTEIERMKAIRALEPAKVITTAQLISKPTEVLVTPPSDGQTSST